MYQSSLPDEVNSSRPKGMLDRDLRTTLTVRGDSNHRNNQPSTSDQYENCQNNNCTNMRTEVNRSGGYTYRCIYDKQLKDADSLWMDRSMSKMQLDRKCPSSRGFYRSLQRTKFGHCLLVFLCIWLATIHRTCAYPAMSDDLNLSAQRCRAIKDALIKPIEMTDVASKYFRKLLENYTQVQFNKHPSELHAVWRHQLPHFHYDVNFVPNEKVILTDDYEGEPDASQLKHIQGVGIPTNAELEAEFQRIYVFLHTIKEALDKIREDRRKNETQILHDLNNDENTRNSINSMFEEHLRYNNLQIGEVKTAMKALNIPDPENVKVTIGPMNGNPIVGEWITIREHLKILRYMEGVYNTFKNRCHQ